MLKITGKSRLTKAELEDIWENAGITQIQYEIIKLRYYDRNKYTVVKICDTLSISDGAYKYQLRQAVGQVNRYLGGKI
jgi:hypothetical protein